MFKNFTQINGYTKLKVLKTTEINNKIQFYFNLHFWSGRKHKHFIVKTFTTNMSETIERPA